MVTHHYHILWHVVTYELDAQGTLTASSGPTLAAAVRAPTQDLVKGCIDFIQSLDGTPSPKHLQLLAGVVLDHCTVVEAMPLNSAAALGRHITRVR